MFESDAGSRVGSLSPHLRSLQAGCLPQMMMTEKHMLPDPSAYPPTAAGFEELGGSREGGSQPSLSLCPMEGQRVGREGEGRKEMHSSVDAWLLARQRGRKGG